MLSRGFKGCNCWLHSASRLVLTDAMPLCQTCLRLWHLDSDHDICIHWNPGAEEQFMISKDADSSWCGNMGSHGSSFASKSVESLWLWLVSCAPPTCLPKPKTSSSGIMKKIDCTLCDYYIPDKVMFRLTLVLPPLTQQVTATLINPFRPSRHRRRTDRPQEEAATK